MRIEFVNACGHTVVLTGPSKETIQFIKNERKVLTEWYKRYVPRYLRVIRVVDNVAAVAATPQIIQQPRRASPTLNIMANKIKQPPQAAPKSTVPSRAVTRPLLPKPSPKLIVQTRIGTRAVGHASMMGHQATAYLRDVISKLVIPVSDDVGVGILSYNRIGSICRLVESIRKFTDLKKTTVFISDESTDEKVKAYLSTVKDMVILDNKERLGVAGNTNRLMRCLERFRYKILLNDDVEVLAPGWEYLYANAIDKTSIHHFCMRQIGVLKANGSEGKSDDINGIKIWTIKERPHGAVIAYDVTASKAVGYFDEQFGIYGMEHVDWSNRVGLSGIQKQGYHDVLGSDSYFKIHSDASKVEEKGRHLSEAKKKFDQAKDNRSRIYVNPTARSEVKKVAFIVPFRGIDRGNAIGVVLHNIKAQKFPAIEIIMVEQDSGTHVHLKYFESVQYVLAILPPNTPFAKAYAFNVGVAKVTTDKIILHDGDMLVQDNYAQIMHDLLCKYDAVHIGKNVIYLNYDSTNYVAQHGKLDHHLVAEKMVGYYEGGSLGIRYNSYVDIGGFCEEFVGYGVEDCEFFNRVLHNTNFFNERSIDLLHMWHSRTSGWIEHHSRNKKIGDSLLHTPMQQRLSVLRTQLLNRHAMKAR